MQGTDPEMGEISQTQIGKNNHDCRQKSLYKHRTEPPLRTSSIAAPPLTTARLQLRLGRVEGRQNSRPTTAGTLAHGRRLDHQIAHACDHMHARNRAGDDRLIAPLNSRRLRQPPPPTDGDSSAWIQTN